MADPAARFFTDLEEQRHLSLLEGSKGTLLVELHDAKKTERWYVVIKRGDITVAKKGGAADCTLRTDRETFRAIVDGQMNAMAAVLRGRVEIEGKVSLLAALQSLFKPSSGAGEQRTAGYARRSS